MSDVSHPDDPDPDGVGDYKPAEPPNTEADCCPAPDIVPKWRGVGDEQQGWICQECGATLGLDLEPVESWGEQADDEPDGGGDTGTETYVDRFRSFYRDVPAVTEAIRDLEDSFGPESRSLRIAFDQLEAHDPDLAADLLDRPANLIAKAEEALRQSSRPIRAQLSRAGDQARVNVRVRGLPDEHRYRVGEYRTRHLGSLIAVRGTVVDVEAVVPNVEVGEWECQRCGSLTRTSQQYGDMIEPHQCPACENQGPWQLDEEASDLVDLQTLFIIPVETALDDPPGLPVYLKDDLCGSLGKGDSETFVGRFEIHPQQKETQLQTYLEVVDIEEADGREAGVDAEELRETLIERTTALQQDGNGFGVDRALLLDDVMTDAMREKEVNEVLDSLIDDDELKVVNDAIVNLD